MSSKFSLSALKWFGSVAVITLASHARGPGFDPQPNQSRFFCLFCFWFLVFFVFVFDIGLSPLRGPFFILSVPTRSQLIQFELVKPTGYLTDPVEGSSKFPQSTLKRFCSVVVITLASHAKGPEFNPQQNQSRFFVYFLFVFVPSVVVFFVFVFVPNVFCF